MASFFDKLKKEMDIEMPQEETIEEENPIEKKIIKKVRKVRAKKLLKEAKPIRIVKEEIQSEPIEEIKEVEIKTASPKKEEVPIKKMETEQPKEETTFVPQKAKLIEREEKLFEAEGQLAVDIYQTEKYLVVQSAIAGVKIENLEITMEKDILTVKGRREKPFEEAGDYFSQECYWGPFSREIILPAEVDPNQTVAEMKEGILTIRIPKILREKKRKIAVRLG